MTNLMRQASSGSTTIARVLSMLALAVLVFALASGQASAAPSPAEFQDPTADSGSGPDITKVTVSADDAGTVTFRVEISNRPTVSSNLFVLVYLDTDSNPDTGDPNVGGAEYVLGMVGGSVALLRWTGSGVEGVTPSSASGGYASGVATLSVNASDLGGAKQFRFWVGATDNPDDDGNWDAAPRFGAFAYHLETGVVHTIKGYWVPATVLFPKPGRVMSAQGIRLRLDNDEVARADSMQCTLRLAGKTIRPLAGGCKWRIPASARGKRGTLKITFTYQGQTVTHTFTVHVRNG